MKISIVDSFHTLPYFTIESVKQLWGESAGGAASVRTALYRWMKTGQIIQLKKGLYMSRRFYEQRRGDADFSPVVSAILVPQSYVSLEYILQRHAVLTEITYPVSAVTSKNTRVIENKLGIFSYRHIKSSLYHGFTISETYGIPFAQASPAKALFDYLYLRPWSGIIPAPSYNLAEELRLNLEGFSRAERDEFSAYVTQSRLRKMEQILNNFRRTVWQP